MGQEAERAERLREVLEDLTVVNMEVPVIVEGKRDATALRALGLMGEIITLNRGQSLHDFTEDLLDSYDYVILLMDWDQTGEKLHQRLSQELAGHWEAHEGMRRVLKILCQKDTKDVEGIPSLLARLAAASEIPRP